MLRQEFPEARKLRVVDYGFPLVRIIDLTDVDFELGERICKRADAVFFDVMARCGSTGRHG
jgi:hypothetical protein